MRPRITKRMKNGLHWYRPTTFYTGLHRNWIAAETRIKQLEQSCLNLVNEQASRDAQVMEVVKKSSEQLALIHHITYNNHN